ncbi:RabGAP/TBC [Cyathus striatus]|nr:RabGAP/TBC [Cyathus striatus]
MDRRQSLRTKLSLPNLRRKRSKQDDSASLASPGIVDSETLQVKDMDFELVRPNIGRFEASRASEDSGPSEVRPEFLRAESPAFSVASGGGTSGPSAPGSRATTDSESSMDAHRQRELKWMTIMSSTPPSQSRKIKKVKKLLLDGVPSSVRYLVWSMLTDGKARVVPDVYSKLGQRGRVPASSDIERDTKLCFQDQPHLHGTEGPVLSLLQAYLSMVPDVQYTRGLTLIAGQLLLLAPQEDAFWIFVSIMDTHIRPYFSTSITQMEVDSALFSRAFESNDSVAAKKVFVDMGISPSSICAPWFSSLFVGSLPPDYLNRVWDIFLFEGIPFLLRVGLAIMQCCRRQVLGSTSEDALLALLRHPPQAVLPSTPDAFLTLTFSVKLKDDDVRKQRVKMEALVKRQTHTPMRNPSSTSAISLPRA